MKTQIELLIPKFSANDEAVKITSWLVEDQTYVESGQPILIAETAKTSVEIESKAAGYISQQCKPDEIKSVGSCFGMIFSSLSDLAYHLKQIPTPKESQRENATTEDMPTLSNAAREYIQQHQLNKNDFTDLGLVTIDKIKAKLEKNKAKENQHKLDSNIFPKASVESLSFSKLAEIERLVGVNNDAIISSLTVQFNTDNLRKSLSKIPQLNNRILPYILYLFSSLLSNHPKFTSFYAEKQLYLYNRVNLGLAIDLGKGLKVATIEDSNTLTLSDLQTRMIDIIAQYHEDTLPITAVQNSTVTVTDLSHDGILHFQPVLNANQTIILGIGGDETLHGFPLSLTIVFDHRVLSGQEVGNFLKQLKESILTEHLYLISSLDLTNEI